MSYAENRPIVHLTGHQKKIWPWVQEKLQTPFWRCYWCVSEGAFLKIGANEVPLHTDLIYIVPGYMKFSTFAEQPFEQFYIHFTPPEKYFSPECGLLIAPASERWKQYWLEWDVLEKSSERDFFRRELLAETILAEALLSMPKEVITKTPFVPEDKEKLEKWCALALEIQSRSLAARLIRSYSQKCIIGVSGGLDSTLALLVCARAMDMLGRGRENVVAITMPCYGTTERTKSNALALSDMLGCDGREIDIKAAVTQHFKDISHDENCYNVVYENAQARERTQILMDVANAEGGIVVGTGDLSELALGFATYNGDHMSMYGVNASVPKTLMREIISYEARRLGEVSGGELARVLLDVVKTPVSPELLPTDGKEVTQQTEDIVGPYVLHDFFLYHTIKHGRAPKEILKLCKKVFTEYSEEYIKKYLEIFTRRFFTQQFKRSAMPDGPRVTEISLSPRGAFNMPSDAASNILRRI